MKFDNYKVIDNRVFFTGSFLSNWYISDFRGDVFFDDNIHGTFDFNCVEQYMMAQKALTFKDYESFLKIMGSKTPKEQKALGREVKNYINDVWETIREEVVKRGIEYKFISSIEMLVAMDKFPNGTEFVECAAYDNIWGIGLAITDPNIADDSKWTGQNLLGKAITQVHKWILRDEE